MIRRLEVSRASAMNVAERWRQQYYEEQVNKWPKTACGQSEDVYNQLCDLGVNPDPDAAAKIIGNKSWTHLNCVSCNTFMSKAMSIGTDEDKTIICEPCLDAALIEIRRA